ncbi:cytochrome b, partial [Bordetella pertussis]
MQPTATSVRIWDLPTRLFHWAFAAAVIGALVTVKLGGLYMDWHVRFGLTALGLVLFRLIWGFVGPRHARFATFVRGPGAMLAYL